MSNFYEEGRILGIELGQRNGTVRQDAAGAMTDEQNLDFINGIMDGVEEAKAALKGIRVSQEILMLLRNSPLSGPNDTYRGVRFALDQSYFPNVLYEFEV
ncbi:hypothetical protein [Brucella haematophila]|uniref:hypothetical protein n=1 Tax=Brucella haematophila TaxID=419474 RepID=UPI00110DDF79|nr:hypothetical protein [Brucella haematophila]TMU91525.1 hypothetical protein FGI60_21900 [Brucella haematophila]